MLTENQDFAQLINTAIIKTKEKKLKHSYEDRLAKACHSPVIASLGVAISHLAETQNLSNDQAAIMIVETVRELNSVWEDYISMEGINHLKNLLKTNH